MDAAPTIPNTDGDTGGVVVQRFNSIAAELAPVTVGGFYAGDIGVGECWLRGYGDDNGLLGLVLDRGAEGILKHFGHDVLEVHGDRGKRSVGLSVNVEQRPDAIAKLTNVGNKGGAGLNDGSGLQRSVDNTNEGGVFWTGRRACLRVEMRLAAEV